MVIVKLSIPINTGNVFVSPDSDLALLERIEGSSVPKRRSEQSETHAEEMEGVIYRPVGYAGEPTVQRRLAPDVAHVDEGGRVYFRESEDCHWRGGSSVK